MRDFLIDLEERLESLGKGVFAVICFIVAFLMSMVFAYSISSESPAWLGMAIWSLFMVLTIHHFVVYVPPIMGLQMENMLTAGLEPYGRGLSWVWPWERVYKKTSMKLRQKLVLKSTFASLDGAMTLSWLFAYKPRLGRLDSFTKAGEEKIEEALEASLGGIMSAKMSKLSGTDCKGQQANLGPETIEQLTTEEDLGKIYGIDLIRVKISDMDYEADVAKAKAAINVADTARRIANDWKKDHPEMSGQEAADRALVLTDKITRTIHEHKITGDVGNWIGALGAAIGSALANKNRRDE